MNTIQIGQKATYSAYMMKKQLRQHARHSLAVNSFLASQNIIEHSIYNSQQKHFSSTRFQNISPYKAVTGRKVRGQVKNLNFSYLRKIEDPSRDTTFALPEQEVDPIEQSEIAQKFINLMMKDGKKQRATRMFKRSLRVIKSTLGGTVHLSPLTILEKAVLNCTPQFAISAYRYRGCY